MEKMKASMTPSPDALDSVQVAHSTVTICADDSHWLKLIHVTPKQAIDILTTVWWRHVQSDVHACASHRRQTRAAIERTVAVNVNAMPITDCFFEGGTITNLCYEGADHVQYEYELRLGSKARVWVPGSIPQLHRVCYGCRRYAPHRCPGTGDKGGNCRFLYCTPTCRAYYLWKHDYACERYSA